MWEIHTSPGADVVPEVEAWVDLEQVQALVRSPLEVELRNPSQIQARRELTAELIDVLVVRGDQGSAVTELSRMRSYLLPGELAADLPVLGNVDVVALDLSLWSGHELLNDDLEARVDESRPELAELLASVDPQSLGVNQRRPDLVLPDERLDDDGQLEIDVLRARC